jgi:hypothetical protein
MYVGFSAATTAMFGLKQTLMPHLFCGTNALLSGRALCLTFWLGLTCYPDGSVHRFTGCFWGKSYQKHGASTTELQLTLHVRYENISSPIIAGLDRACLWLVLPGHQTLHQWISSSGAILKPCFTSHQLILKRILLPVLLRQQQPGIFECTHQSLCQLCIEVGGLCLNICCTTFLQNTSVVLLDFQPVRPTLMVRGTTRMHVQHIVVWQYIFVLVPPSPHEVWA